MPNTIGSYPQCFILSSEILQAFEINIEANKDFTKACKALMCVTRGEALGNEEVLQYNPDWG